MKPFFIVTGVTGFVGSALVAQALSQGIPVAALSRDDGDGQRTREAVRRAVQGMELTDRTDLLKVYSFDEAGLRAAVDDIGDGHETSFWHCAAEMTYSYRKMRKSLEFNVSRGLELLGLCHGLGVARFYYFSTAFTTNGTGDEQTLI